MPSPICWVPIRRCLLRTLTKQQIQLELLGDGITGIVYEAGPEGIVPLRSREAGPAGAFVILAVNLLLWGGFWLLVRLIPRLLATRYSQ
jgi:hypothetical protein